MNQLIVINIHIDYRNGAGECRVMRCEAQVFDTVQNKTCPHALFRAGLLTSGQYQRITHSNMLYSSDVFVEAKEDLDFMTSHDRDRGSLRSTDLRLVRHSCGKVRETYTDTTDEWHGLVDITG